jgi:DNA repair protein RecO (recombination protein O)
MYLKSDAIIINRWPVMNTSYVLSFYSKRAGKLTVLAKGAARRRKKAEPPSIPDLFQRGEVVLWFGRRRDYALLREWTLEDMRPGLRSDYDAFRAASGCAALVAELARGSDDPGEYYQGLDDALEVLSRGANPRPVLWAFSLKALTRAGFVAPPTSCAVCGRSLGGSDSAIVSPADGGLVCGACEERLGDADAPRLRLPPDAVGTARFLATSSIDAAAKLRVSPRCAAALDRASVMLSEYHLETSMAILLPEGSRA